MFTTTKQNKKANTQKILLIVSLQSYFIYPDTIKRNHFILSKQT